tara:strand:- start:99 stop:743 length:645 start_codon:yes stop_codon:yes gene_type:complete
MENVTRLKAAALDVVAWNAVAYPNGEHDFSTEKKAAQYSFVRSELGELIAGALNDDVVEAYDGIADVFVTLSYLHFLNTTGAADSFDSIEPDMQEYPGEWVEDAALIFFPEKCVIGDELVKASFEGMCEKIITDPGVDVLDVIEEVMRSNWTKYPMYVEGIESECQWIEQNRPEAEGVVMIKTESGRCVFKNSKGKIMKPSTFEKPDIRSILGM